MKKIKKKIYSFNKEEFVSAAEKISSGENIFCCIAIKNYQDEKNFAKLFKPKWKSKSNGWWHNDENMLASTPQTQLARSLALLLCAEIGEIEL